ncbi:DUF6702 family protein [Congregibacter sp.]|uniref:DUF6702 family protein n=1 Tax=Congregibacter sp. TaxID=2744308 RepID=UPI003F6C4BD0
MLLAIAHAGAHRGHAVWTDITWSGESFEIVHRMHLADAIVVNRYMGGTQPIEELRSLALVALYVDERFKLLSGESAEDQAVPTDTIKLTTIGAEIEDDFLLVYQEWVTPLPERFPVIDNLVLLDVEPESQAFIKIKGPGLDEERER